MTDYGSFLFKLCKINGKFKCSQKFKLKAIKIKVIIFILFTTARINWYDLISLIVAFTIENIELYWGTALVVDIFSYSFLTSLRTEIEAAIFLTLEILNKPNNGYKKGTLIYLSIYSLV